MTDESELPRRPISVRESVGIPAPPVLVGEGDPEAEDGVRHPVEEAGDPPGRKSADPVDAPETAPSAELQEWAFLRGDEEWTARQVGSTQVGPRGDPGVTIRLLHFQRAGGDDVLELPWVGARPEALYDEEWVALLERARTPTPLPDPTMEPASRRETRPRKGR